MDTIRDHYQVVVVGWRGMKRTFGILVQIDLKDDLVWVQEDNTEYRVAEALVQSGISKDKIVLGFQAPYKRPYSGFATGE
jgi:XisI protein